LGSSHVHQKRKRPKKRVNRKSVTNKRAVLVSEGFYHNDLKHGLWREYYESGQVMIEEYYRYGVQHGKFTSYHPNGKLFGEGQYEDGKREGYFKVYDENGNQIKTLLFIHNNLMEEVENTTNESQNISSP